MKRLLACGLAAVAVCSSVSALGACSQVIDDVDATKTQLYIANYNGGVGEKWLDEAAKRFEAQYKDVVFEPGTDKVGAQIMIDHNKAYDGLSLKTSMATDSKYEVYFTGGANYLDYTGNKLLYDLTDLVSDKVNADDGKTILSKIDAARADALTVGGKIYAIPHYELFPGPSYDAGVFQAKKLYFADTIDTSDTEYPGTRTFVVNNMTKKSCGPNGIYGDYDDGLPSSVHEFYKLMDKMTKNNVEPFVWTGASTHYTNQLIRTLYANLGGIELMNATHEFDSHGKPIEIVTGFNPDGTPIIQNTVITTENGYLVKQAAALYYGIEFAQKIRSNQENFHLPCVSSTFSHLTTQEAFANSGLNGEDYIGMIIDGNWWYNEANDDGIFERLAYDYPEDYTKKDYKVMPMPVQYAGTVTEGNGKAPVVFTTGDSFAFVNNNIQDHKIMIMEEFLSFVYSDAELCKFTEITNGILRGVNYDYSSVKTNLNSFANSAISLLETAKAAGTFRVAMTSNKIHNNNRAVFALSMNQWIETMKGMFPIAAFDTSSTKKDAENWFKSLWITGDAWATMKKAGE